MPDQKTATSMVLMYRDGKGDPHEGATISGTPARWAGEREKIAMAQTIMQSYDLDPTKWADLEKAYRLISGSVLWLAKVP